MKAAVGLMCVAGLGVALIPASPAAGAAPSALKPAPVVIVGNAMDGGAIEVRGRNVNIGASTALGVRQAEGRKPDEVMGLIGKTGPAGTLMTYRYQVDGKRCEHVYAFPEGRNRLSDFWSTCPTTKSARGVRPGQTVTKANAKAGPTSQLLAQFTAWECPIDDWLVLIDVAGTAFVLAVTDNLDLVGPARARIYSVGAYQDVDKSVYFSSLGCERRTT